MNNDRIIYRGTIEFLPLTVTSSKEINNQVLRISFDRETWLDTEWSSVSEPILDDQGNVIGHKRSAQILVDDDNLPALPTPAFFRIVDTPEAQIVKGNRNVRVE